MCANEMAEQGHELRKGMAEQGHDTAQRNGCYVAEHQSNIGRHGGHAVEYGLYA